MEKNYIFTFGVGHKYGGHYVKIRGTYENAREEMFERFGKSWAFQYEEEFFFDWHAKHPEVPMETELEGGYHGWKNEG